MNNVDSLVATRELRGLVDAGLVIMQGTRRWAHYALSETKLEGGMASRRSTVNERQYKALEYLHKNGKITTAEYLLEVGEAITECTVQRDLRQLEASGLIRRVGKTRNAHYILVKHE